MSGNILIGREKGRGGAHGPSVRVSWPREPGAEAGRIRVQRDKVKCAPEKSGRPQAVPWAVARPFVLTNLLSNEAGEQ